jgi:polysaccharide pyruvyl transferase CsaB
MPSPLRIAVSGYYGCGNTGDEAVLAGITASFARRAGAEAARFTVFSANPEDTRRRHGLDAVDRMSRAALRATLRETDLLLSGGGSLLQDTTSLRSLLYYLWVLRLAQSMRVPTMFYAQGIGPLRRPAARALTRIVANRARAITVRDPGSEELLRAIGVSRVPVHVTADPAFALQPAPAERVDALLAAAGVLGNIPLLGVAVRQWPAGPSEETYASALREAARRAGSRVVFLPMQPPGDVELSHAIAARLTDATVLEEPLSPQEAVGVCGRLDALLAMRLHALIFASLSGVPLTALSYDPKVAELMILLGQAGQCLPLDVPAAELSERVADSFGRGREALRDRARALEDRTLENVDIALAAAR